MMYQILLYFVTKRGLSHYDTKSKTSETKFLRETVKNKLCDIKG